MERKTLEAIGDYVVATVIALVIMAVVGYGLLRVTEDISATEWKYIALMLLLAEIIGWIAKGINRLRLRLYPEDPATP